MTRKRKTKFSIAAGEMQLLSLLWREGEISLSEAHHRFDRPIGYTTMQTRLNRLVEKGLVKKSNNRPTKYSAAVAPHDVSSRQLDVLIDRVADGSVVPLVAQLVNKHSISSKEIQQIKDLIKQAEKRILQKGKTK